MATAPPEALLSAFTALQDEPFEGNSPDGVPSSADVGVSGSRSRASPCPSIPGLPSPFNGFLSLDASNKSSGAGSAQSLSRRGSWAPASARPASGSSRKGPPQLWRTSTAISDRVAAALGFSGVQQLCGSSFIPPHRLKNIKALGEGAFAVVEKALLLPASAGDSTAGPSSSSVSSERREVAVKHLKPDILESERDCWAFITEARLLISIAAHPAIIGYIGLGCDDESSPEAEWRTLYLVQELAAGGTIKKLIFDQMVSHRRKLYSLGDAVRWGAQIAEGLAFMHSNNPRIIHRDLKAENVLLSPNPQLGRLDARIADFGLHALVPGGTTTPAGAPACKDISSKGGPSTPLAGEDGGDTYKMTGCTGAFVYMAPEVLLGKKYNEKVDVFSFGVILYELLHRKMIVADLMHLGDLEAAKDHALKVAGGYRMPISSDLPVALQLLLADCWAERPDDRPSMEEVAKRLRAAERSGEVEQAEHKFGPPPGAGCCTVM